jgi:hypothetical protein
MLSLRDRRFAAEVLAQAIQDISVAPRRSSSVIDAALKEQLGAVGCA